VNEGEQLAISNWQLASVPFCNPNKLLSGMETKPPKTLPLMTMID
jgi:hypothetical protein